MTNALRRALTTALAAGALAVALPGLALGQPRRLLNGEWTGTLALDNSSPHLALVFDVTDSSLDGKVYSDGRLLGPMESLSLKGDTVHFKIDRLDFTGRLNATTMRVSLIVYNGSERTLTLTKTPDMPARGKPSPSSSVAVLVDGGNHAERWWRERLADGIVALTSSWSSASRLPTR